MRDNVDSGMLRHRVILQRIDPDIETEATGGEIDQWYDVGTYWAYLEPMDGKELVNAREIVAEVSHKITMRVVGPVTTQDRFKYQNRIFGIGQVFRHLEVNNFYEILCKEKMGVTQ